MSPHFSPSLSPGHLLGLGTVIPKQEEEDPSFQCASAQLDGVYDLVRHQFQYSTLISLVS